MAYELFPDPAPTLSLAGLEPFAKGTKRHCYVHPDDTDLCIKVPARANDERCLIEHQMDLEDYRMLKQLGSDAVFERIPAIEGVVGTDKGIGIVVRLYRDADHAISQKLSAHIVARGMTPPLVDAIDELKLWLGRHRLLTRDTGPHNVVAVDLSRNKWKLVIIEGWLNHRLRWLSKCHRTMCDYLIRRELRKFDRRTARALAVYNSKP